MPIFATVGNKFCFKHSVTGRSHSLKQGAVPSVFPWTKVDGHEESRCVAERLQARCEISESAKSEVNTHQNKEQQNEIRDRSNKMIPSFTVHERLLHELQESKSKERIDKFSLQRFSGSSEDIKFYTGFPDYATLIEFWKYIESSASNLTFYCYMRDKVIRSTQKINFPTWEVNKRGFPEAMLVVEGQLMNFGYF